MKLPDQLIDSIEINPDHPAQHSVIWLHGLGADGSDFVSIVPELHLPKALNVRFIFPHAPVMAVTMNNGYKMRAWFDLYDLTIAAKIDEAGILNASRMLDRLIAREESLGVPAQNIILAGFSQGAVVALTTGLRFPKKLGGIMALSGYLPLAEKVLADASPANQATPIFIAHGTQDAVLPCQLGEMTSQILNKAHYPVDWHMYPMQHSVCGEEVRDISAWMQKVWGKS